MKKAVLAFSGGLDTTFCGLWLREQTGARVPFGPRIAPVGLEVARFASVAYRRPQTEVSR